MKEKRKPEQSELEQLSVHFALETEQFLLGCVLRNGWKSWEQVTCLDPDDFGFERHAKLFKYMRRLADADIEPVFAEVYAMILTRLNESPAKGKPLVTPVDAGFPDLLDMHSWGIDDARLGSYCTILRQRRIDRAGFRLADTIKEYAAEGLTGRSAEIAAAQRELEKLEGTLTLGTKPATVGTIIERVGGLDRLFTRPVGTIDWPLGTLTRAMNGGLAPGTVTVLAARPSDGKSALALQVVHRCAVSGRRPALFSLEMLDDELMKRLISQNSAVPLTRLIEGNLTATERSDARRAAAALDELPIELYTGPMSSSQISSQCMNARHRFDLVVVDYLGLVEASGRFSNRQEAVAYVSRQFKTLAMTLKAAVLVLHQLGREPEKDNRRPYLSDLRESGAIEQDANNVVFIHMPDRKKPSTPKDMYEIIVAKQRNGPREITLVAKFDAKHTRFIDPDADEKNDEPRLF